MNDEIRAILDRRPGIRLIAEVCHDANRALCIAQGDDSHRSWFETEDWQRESIIRGVVFALDNPGVTPKDQHDAWMRDKIADGWIYGPVKNPDRKIHNCLLPYCDLPREQHAKDHVFRAIVMSMKRALAVVSFPRTNAITSA